MLPFRGFLLDPDHPDNCLAVVYMDDPVANRTLAVRYQSRYDFAAIKALSHFLNITPPAETGTERPEIVSLAEEEVIEKLRRHVGQYSIADMTMETVAIENIVSLCRMVRGFKFDQTRVLYHLFRKAELQRFQCAAVAYPNGGKTIITPPVVEESGGKFILIQGTTRTVYAHRSGDRNIRCLVVRNPTGPIPSDLRIPLRHVFVGGRTVSTKDRYEREFDDDFRRIEFATHYPTETLV